MATYDEAHISRTEDKGTVTVTGAGALTYLNAEEFGISLKEASINSDDVVVDLNNANFIDTQIVQDLGRAAITLLKRGKRLRVTISETAYPLRVLKISGYESIMDIEAESSK